MRLPLLIARRYLLSKKSHSAINIISIISVVVTAVVTAAMVIVLSVFNGFEGLVTSLYHSFDPPLRITPATGKVFNLSSDKLARISTIDGVSQLSGVLEENCLLRYRDRQYFATLKGVPTDFLDYSGVKDKLTDGQAHLTRDSASFALLGLGVAYHISANLHDPFSPIEVYVPKRGARPGIDPTKSFNARNIFPSGYFSVHQDVDLRYVIVPLAFARDLLDRPTGWSAIEVFLKEGADASTVKEPISEILGTEVTILDRFEQHATLYTIMHTEKWAIFLILTFILLIAIFNVMGSLTMLILEKKSDMAILRSMGADNVLLRQVFMAEGAIIAAFGALIGLTVGLTVCWIQMKFGIIAINTGGSYVVQSYPVVVQWPDVVAVAAIVLAIGAGASWLPVWGLIKPQTSLRVENQ